MSIVVFDIDGVLADATHRQHFVSQRPKDWDAFFAAVGDDAVIEAGRARLLAAAADSEVVLVSGRPERTRTATLRWLADHGMGTPRLILRADSDYRPAPVVKAELLASLEKGGDIRAIIDDDVAVVKALAAIGYPTELFPADTR